MSLFLFALTEVFPFCREVIVFAVSLFSFCCEVFLFAVTVVSHRTSPQNNDEGASKILAILAYFGFSVSGLNKIRVEPGKNHSQFAET